MRHFPHQPPVLRLAREHHPLAADESFLQKRLVEPQRPHESRFAADEHAQQRPSGAGVAEFRFLDGADDGLRFSLFQIGDLAAIGQVLVAAGKEEEQVLGGIEAQSPEQLRTLWPHAAEKLHGHGKLFGNASFVFCPAHL